MDPLSVTASIIAVITAAGKAFQLLEDLNSRMCPHVELIAIMNTVTDLQGTLIFVRSVDKTLRNSTIPAAMQGYMTLPDTIARLQHYLDQLIDFAHVKLLKKGKGLARIGLSKKEREQLVQIRSNISDARGNLLLLLVSANLYACRGNMELKSTIEEACIVQNESNVQISTTLNQMSTQIAAVHDLQVDLSRNNQQVQSRPRSILEQTVYDSSDTSSNLIRMKMTVPSKACDATCNCQCHVRTRSQTPRWLSAVVGTLFYNSTYTPSLDVRPCNVRACFRSPTYYSSQLTYYFPGWIARKALVYSSWNNLQGTNSSWVVKMPREISNYQLCWHPIQSGWVEIVKELLRSREMSPYDINPEGASPLHVAVHSGRLEICALLTVEGADWHFKSRSGASASDIAWTIILRYGESSIYSESLRALAGPLDSYDLHLGPLHRIILGFSSANLAEQIDLEPSRINDRDWIGRTPLMWAAIRCNHIYANVLLSRGAGTDLTDCDGATALLLATRVGSYGIVESLLKAGANPNIADENGFTPLHDIYLYSTETDIAKTITLLHKNGADLEARTKLGWTPLFNAIDERFHRVAEVLVGCGADINALNVDWESPIDRAIFRGNSDTIRMLCQHGAKISPWNNVDGKFHSFIITSAWWGTAEILDILSDSTIPPIEFSGTEEMKTYKKFYCDLYHKAYIGSSHVPEEERTAFLRLLDRKITVRNRAEALESSVAMGLRLNEDYGKDEEHNEESDEVQEYDSEDEDFEDASEHISSLEESASLGS